MRNQLEETSEGWRVRQTADYAPAHGIPRPSLIEATATHRFNPSATFSCWDFTLTALVYRLACHYGERLADYSVTFTQKNAQGDWVAL